MSLFSTVLIYTIIYISIIILVVVNVIVKEKRLNNAKQLLIQVKKDIINNLKKGDMND
ncbi:hypothetical protein Remus_131 [Silviavirus remus]|uniref:Uncharacterized protein n=3 Tax=Silviavirus remus TaxID=1857890 RepID=A0A8E5KAV6_9CAUD|nr:hypothetical protein PM56_121 [Staphylococcus phage PM56]QVD58559.1 hypothetical protein PM93_132 [Staphylococcus phage PM93]QVD58762.1 hypothetical protein Remus_131 [Silviavirus remus]QVD58953.1 hypothetical protein Romulus_121 [Staphylococcus phage Romulus]